MRINPGRPGPGRLSGAGVPKGCDAMHARTTGRVAAGALFLGALAHAQSDNLLTNPGFEDGTRAPDAWTIAEAPRGVAIRRDNRITNDGRGSLKLSKSVNSYFPPAGAAQTLERDPSWRAIRLEADVRTVRATKLVLDVQFAGDGQEAHEWAAYIGAEQEGDPPVTHDWTRYSGVVQVPDWARTVTIAVQIWGPGSAWVDNIHASPVEGAEPAPDQAPDAAPDSAPTIPAAAPDDEPEIADAPPGEDITIAGDANKRYILHNPAGEAPAGGYKLLVVLPGGDGSADFAPFVANVAARAMPEGYIVAQGVAPVWTDSPDRIVWPTKNLPGENMLFPTEQLVEDIIRDVRGRHALDAGNIYVLGWSSGGPASYASTIRAGSPVRGAFVAMSVFKPEMLPALGGAAGKGFYILHSPTDFIPMRFPEDARDRLTRSGARTNLVPYEGGHGWHGDAFGMIRAGVEWLEKNAGG